MAEYQRSRHIDVTPDELFAFVSDLHNLPVYLPTVTSAEPEADGRIRIRGAMHGKPYVDEGEFNVEPARRRVEWRVEEREYAGWLSVHGDDGGAQVVVRLTAPPFVTPSGQPVTAPPAGSEQIQQDLERALDSLRNVMEGRGGKVEPAHPS